MAASAPHFTFEDALDYATARVAGGTDAPNQNDVYDAVQAAYREVGYKRGWKYLQRFERITTVAPYSTGTITYDHTGGTFERELTLASGTWPTEAANGWVRIDDVDYEIDERKSGTVVTLTERANPGADVAAGTTYQFYKDTYKFSATVAALMFPPSHQTFYGMHQIDLGEWLELRTRSTASGVPTHYALGPHPHYGYWAMYLWPYPTTADVINLMAHHRPRHLIVTGKAAADRDGTVTSSGTTVTGVNTAFAAKHVGSVLRFSPDAVDLPTGTSGRNAAQYERKVIAVASTTSLTIDSSLTVSSGVKYSISDPVDFHESMLNYFRRAIDMELSMLQPRGKLPDAAAGKREAMIAAFEADANMPANDWGHGGGLHRVVITTG